MTESNFRFEGVIEFLQSRINPASVGEADHNTDGGIMNDFTASKSFVGKREPHKPCLNFDRHCGHCAEHADDEKSIFSGLFRTAAGEEKIVAQKKEVSWDGVFCNPRSDDGSDYDPFPNRTAEEASIQEARKSGSIFDYAGMFKAQRGEVSNE